MNIKILICGKCWNIIIPRDKKIRNKYRRCSECGSRGSWLLEVPDLRELIKLIHIKINDGTLDYDTLQLVTNKGLAAPPIRNEIPQDSGEISETDVTKGAEVLDPFRHEIPREIIDDYIKWNRRTYSPVSNEHWIYDRYRNKDYPFTLTKFKTSRIEESLRAGRTKF